MSCVTSHVSHVARHMAVKHSTLFSPKIRIQNWKLKFVLEHKEKEKDEDRQQKGDYKSQDFSLSVTLKNTQYPTARVFFL